MYDLAIIGAGPAGIACAKQALKKKLKVILLEKNQDFFGGTCLNFGCIPLKTLLNLSKKEKNWQKILEIKNEVVEKIKRPLLDYLTKLIDIRWGGVCFLDRNTLKVDKEIIKAKNIVIACGSLAKEIEKRSNTIIAEELLKRKDLPNKILIVGAGFIGLEFASLLNNLGKEVYLIEKEEQILPFFGERDLVKRLRIILERKGIKIQTNKDLFSLDLDEFELVIFCGGRKPNIGGLGAERIGLSLSEEGFVLTDGFLRTNLENIYACGDITGKKMLAYTAEYQASLVVKNITEEQSEEDYSVLPECVFSLPQIAKVGILEEEAKKKNISYRLIKSNFLKFSASFSYQDQDGFIKVYLDENDCIIGASIISHYACELINIFSLIIKNHLTLKDLAKSTFIHPTVSEIIPLLLKENL
jgi:dihydrolipoamide dehydrogenase